MAPRTAAIALFLVWLPLGTPQRTFGQCYSGTIPTRCEPVEQTFSLNRVPSVNSTCGTPPALFCNYRVSGSIQNSGCNYTCNSSDASSAHPANLLTDFPISSNPTWWQSSNSNITQDPVSITFNLAALVEVTKITLQFKDLVPQSLYIEKSIDNQLYTLFNFFQTSCYRLPVTGTLTYATEITPLCTLINSPNDFLSTVFVPTNGRPSASDMSPGLSQNLYDFIQAKVIRILLKEHFPISELNPTYYYAIQDLAIVGRFQCNGHATSVTNMACNCQHNTKGVNCEQCLDLYNDIPWERNDGNNSFECQVCNCNQHSSQCVLDMSVYNNTGGTSGGICINCTNNTAGIHCEICATSFYPLPSKNQTDPDVCASCNCDPRGMNDSGDCQKSGPNIGNCFCKANVIGKTCNTCKDGYFNISANNLDGCQDCGCNATGSINLSCSQLTGVCNCKNNVIGQKCDYCKPNYYQQSPFDAQGCQPCNCNLGGSLSAQCDMFTGQCPCRNGVTGRNCSMVVSGRFFPFPDYLILETEFALGSYQKMLLTNGENIFYTGVGFAAVSSSNNSLLNLGTLTPPSGGWYQATFRYSLYGNSSWSSASLEIQAGPEFGAGVPSCTEPNNTLVLQYTQWFTGNNTAKALNVCLRGGRSYQFVLRNLDAGSQEPGRTLNIDSFFLTPIYSSGLAVFQDNFLYSSYNICVNNLQTLPKPQAAVTTCRNTIFQVSTAIFNGTLACMCNTTGSNSSICNEYGGQCSCNAHVSGFQCGYCTPGYYNISSKGCQACNCNPNGSASLICSATDGACSCLSNVTGSACSECAYGFYNFQSGVGCSACNCNLKGSASLQCQKNTGSCTCISHVAGEKCDQCVKGYYNLSAGIGCSSCNCSVTGSIGEDCDTMTGVCFCATGASGRLCNSCLPGYYKNSTGFCEACNCYPKNSLSQNCINGLCTCISGAMGSTCAECIFGYYKASTGACTVCNGCYNQAAATINATNNTLSYGSNLLKSTILPNESLIELLNKTSTDIASLCLNKNDTVNLFYVVEFTVFRSAKEVTEFAVNISQTTDLLNLVQYYAIVVYVNSLASITLRSEIEEEIYLATQCTASTEYLALSELQNLTNAVCNYLSTGQMLYNAVVNYSILLQDQIFQVNNSLRNNWNILDSVNFTIRQAIVLNNSNYNFISVVQTNISDGQMKLNNVNAVLFELVNQTNIISTTISRFISVPIVLPLIADLTALWNSTNITNSFVKSLISQINIVLAQTVKIENVLMKLHLQFNVLDHMLSELMNRLIIDTSTVSSLSQTIQEEIGSVNNRIIYAIEFTHNLQAFKSAFDQARNTSTQLLNKMYDLKMIAQYWAKWIASADGIVSSFYANITVIGNTATVVKVANDEVLTIQSSLPMLMQRLLQLINSSSGLINRAIQTNTTVHIIYSKSQVTNNFISTLKASNINGTDITNQSKKSVYSAINQWKIIKSQLQFFYNQTTNILRQINSTQTLFDIVQQQQPLSTSSYKYLNSTLLMHQSRRLQLEANIMAVQNRVQYLRQLHRVIITRCSV